MPFLVSCSLFDSWSLDAVQDLALLNLYMYMMSRFMLLFMAHGVKASKMPIKNSERRVVRTYFLNEQIDVILKFRRQYHT